MVANIQASNIFPEMNYEENKVRLVARQCLVIDHLCLLLLVVSQDSFDKIDRPLALSRAEHNCWLNFPGKISSFY